MDCIDQERIEAITPYFEYYNLLDIVPLIKGILLEIRICEVIQNLNRCYIKNDGKIIIEDTFKNLSLEDKIDISRFILFNFNAAYDRVFNNLYDRIFMCYNMQQCLMTKVIIDSEKISLCAKFNKMGLTKILHFKPKC